jgi:hypothetical protein
VVLSYIFICSLKSPTIPMGLIGSIYELIGHMIMPLSLWVSISFCAGRTAVSTHGYIHLISSESDCDCSEPDGKYYCSLFAVKHYRENIIKSDPYRVNCSHDNLRICYSSNSSQNILIHHYYVHGHSEKWYLPLFWHNLKVQTFAKEKLKGTNMFGFVGNLDHNGITTELSISRRRSFRGFSSGFVLLACLIMKCITYTYIVYGLQVFLTQMKSLHIRPILG